MNECPLKRNPLVTGNLDISSSNHQLSGDMIFYPSWKLRKHLLFPTWPRASTFESMFFRHFFSWDVSEKTKWRCMNIHSLLWVDLESLICFFLCFKDGLQWYTCYLHPIQVMFRREKKTHRSCVVGPQNRVENTVFDATAETSMRGALWTIFATSKYGWPGVMRAMKTGPLVV